LHSLNWAPFIVIGKRLRMGVARAPVYAWIMAYQASPFSIKKQQSDPRMAAAIPVKTVT